MIRVKTNKMVKVSCFFITYETIMWKRFILMNPVVPNWLLGTCFSTFDQLKWFKKFD